MTGSSEEEGEGEGEEDQDNRKLGSVCQSLWIFIIKDLEINVNKARALTATRNRKISRRIFKYLNIFNILRGMMIFVQVCYTDLYSASDCS